MPKNIELRWTRYPDFFDLYRKKKDVPKLIYVIGDTNFVYIGNVGSNGGRRGLARRYDKPYIERSMSIFGSDQPARRPCFVAEFRNKRISGPDILNAEKIIQQEFLDNRPGYTPSFTRRGMIQPMTVSNTGTKPGFVDRTIEYS